MLLESCTIYVHIWKFRAHADLQARFQLPWIVDVNVFLINFRIKFRGPIWLEVDLRNCPFLALTCLEREIIIIRWMQFFFRYNSETWVAWESFLGNEMCLVKVNQSFHLWKWVQFTNFFAVFLSALCSEEVKLSAYLLVVFFLRLK